MSPTRFLAPSPKQLRDTALLVLMRLDSKGLDASEGDSLAWLTNIGLEVDPTAAEMASARAHDACWGRLGSLPMMLARVAVAIRFNPVLKFKSAALTRHVAAWTATVKVSELAQVLGYRLDRPARQRLATVLEQAVRAGTAVPDVSMMLGSALLEDIRPAPRIEILTPLTHISAEEQARLLDVAGLARGPLSVEGYHVDIPGERLGPDDDNSLQPTLMYAMERQRVLGACLVVILADLHHSYGAGQCQSWAESMGIDVLVFSGHPSRALGDGYWGTRTEPFTDGDDLVAEVTAQVRSRKGAHLARAAMLAQRRRDWVDSILLVAPRALDSDVSDWLPGRRLDALASSPLELETLTISELRSLREHYPSEAGPVLRALGEPESQVDAALAPLRDFHGAHQISVTESDAPAADEATVHRMLRAHPMAEVMNSPDRSDFVALVLGSALAQREIETVLNQGLDLIGDTAAYHRTRPDRDFWVDILRHLRGIQ